ncbi:uncharacterized protein [Coffea arabica]
MLSLGRLTTWQQCNSAAPRNSKSRAFNFPAKTHPTRVSFSPNRLIRLALFSVLGRPRIGFCIYASNRQPQGGNSALEMHDFEEDDDFFDEEEEEETGFDEDEEFIPLTNMKKWLENKPRGFGEGKVYDTSIEDKLMEEIEQSRKAQLANINNLKNKPAMAISKKEQCQQEKVSEEGKHGFRVRLINLPKKKNIHRDLRSAFKGVPGILDIIPVVSGNKRTKDPICKGLAFIDFKTKNEADRFVQTFSGQSITFGKVQKQIKCDMDFSLLKPGNEDSVGGDSYTDQIVVEAEELYDEFASEDEVHKSAETEESEDSRSGVPIPEFRYGGVAEERERSVTKPNSSKQQGELQEKGKKVASKAKKQRPPKINIPGSANRLKIREKAVLTGVFSKYGGNTSVVTRGQS